MEPAWHDVPPVPGDYQILFDSGNRSAVRVHDHEQWRRATHRKYYGPLPDPPPIPEPPKPPRHFNATYIDGVDAIPVTGVLFPNLRARVFDSGNGNTVSDSLSDLEELFRDIEFLDGAPA